MKARKRDSNEEWKDVAFVQLEGSDILYKEQYLEFQHDESPTELKINDQVEEEKHWQDVRERAAIAAMQGLLADSTFINEPIIKIEEISVSYADALVKQLKRE